MISKYLTLNFDGKSSKDFGIMCVQQNNGLYQDTFVANKTINETQVTGRKYTYFQSVTKDPLEFDLILYWINGIVEEGLQLIKQWINKDTYSEFYFEEYPIRHYFGMLAGESKINYNAAGEGFASIHIHTDSPYAYSPAIGSFDTIPSEGKYIELENKGDTILEPYIQFTKINDGSMSIMNLTNGGAQCIIDNLKDGETITLDNENGMIVSDMDLLHYDDHNGVWVECPVGRNRLFVNGECKMKWNYRYTYY